MMPERSQHLHTRNEVMKPAHIFRDQVNTVAQWFDQWNDIEQTIACYSLLKRIGHTQARFLSLVLEHTFRDSAYEVNILEREANGKEFLKSLCRESKEIAVQQLLLHLPLLHPGNDEARHEYLKLLPKILSHSLEYSIHEEECRQLLSLALVHPAFVPEERNSLTWWLGLIEEKGEKASRPPPGFHQPLTGTKSCQVWGNQQTHQPLKSSLSYKLPQHNGWKEQVQLAQKDSGIGTSFDNSTYTSTGASTNFENTHDDLVRMRSKSFPENPHMPISPQSSLDSDEEAALRRSADALANFPSHPGMKDIPMWLKSLRLHKYADIFGDVTYEDMLAFNDDYLEKHGVTKGARNKIILCINKLKDRKQTLERLETEVLQIGKLPHVLAELKNILVTPIKPPEGNMEEETNAPPENGDALLPAIITRVMGKACTQILVTQPDEDCCLTYLGLLERVLSHEAFVHLDKSRLQSWKAQCQKLARDLATNRKLAKIEKPKNWFDTLNYGAVAGRRRVSNQNSLKRDIPRGPLVNPQHKKLAATNSYHPSLVNQVNNHHAALNRTKSAPIRSGNVTFAQPGLQDTEEINKSLETLGLSMTNHALEDTSETKMTEEELF